MEIRRLTANDIEATVDLWYETSVVAHNFISADFWKENRGKMATVYLPNSETYLLMDDERVVGFISMVDNYLAAIFVRNDSQGKGGGSKLLNFIKENRSRIHLKVYKKNIQSVDFYKRQNFRIISEGCCDETGEIELEMEWTKDI